MVGKLTPMTQLSASRVPAVMGMSPYATANDELAKTVAALKGEAPLLGSELANQEAADWGNRLETVVLQEAAARLGLTSVLYSPDYPFDHATVPLACSADAVASVGAPITIHTDPSRGVFVMNKAGFVTAQMEAVILENKITGIAPEDEPLPHRGPLQLQAQMACTETSLGAVCVLYRGTELRIFVYERGDAVVAALEQMAVDFLGRAKAICRGEDRWFPPQTSADAVNLHPVADETAPPVTLAPEAEQIVKDLLDARRTIEVAERVAEECQTALMEMMGNAERGYAQVDGKTVQVRWPMRHYKDQPAKTTPAKPAYSIRLKTLQIKELA